MATKIENSSVATKNAIRDIVLGAHVLTVGAGGQYANVEAAINYIEGLPTTSQFDIVSTTGALVAPSQGDYNLQGSGTDFQNEIRAGDFISVTGDAVAPFDIAPIYYQIKWRPDSATSLWLVEGIAGAAAGTAFTVIRPRPFVILLMGDTVNDTGSNIDVPNGIDLTIEGVSPQMTQWVIGGTGNAFILHQRYGRLTLENFSVITTTNNKSIISTPLTTTAYWNSSVPAVQEGTLVLNATNVKLNTTAVCSFRASEATIDGISVLAEGGTGLHLGSDAILAKNILVDALGSVQGIVMDHGGRRQYRTRDCYLQNAFVRRLNNAGAAGGVIEIGPTSIATGQVKRYHTQLLDAFDENQGNALDIAVKFHGDINNNTVQHYISDVVSDNTGLGSNVVYTSAVDVVKKNIFDRAGVAL